MVSTLENAKRALRLKLEEQKEYHQILQIFDDFFVQQKNHQAFISSLKEKSLKAHKDSMKFMNDRFINQSELLQANQASNTLSLNSQLASAQTIYKASMQQIEDTYLSEKEKIEELIETEKISFKALLKTDQNEMNKTISAIQKNMNGIKKHYSEQVQIIEKTFEDDLASIQSQYQIKREKIELDIHELKKEYEKTRDDLILNKDKESTSHDQDYINIKTYYNQITKHLNAQINMLKKHSLDIALEITNYYEQKKQPLFEEIKALTFKKNAQKKGFDKTLNDELKILDKERDQLEKTFNDGKKKLTAQTAESVSTLNSKLSNFRELTTLKKQDIIKTFHKNVQKTNRAEVTAKNRQLNALDDELNSLILSSKKKIKDKKIEGQLSLFEHEKNYHKNLTKITYHKKRAYLTYDLNVKQLHIAIDQQERHIKDKIQRIELEAESLKRLLLIHEQYEMTKFETQVMIASETQERDLSQLTQDAFIDIAYLDKDISTLEAEYNQKLLSYQYELDVLNTKESFDIDHLKLNQSRQLEKTSLIRDYDLEEQFTRESLAKHLFDRKLKELNATHTQQVEMFKNELIKLELSFSYEQQNKKYAYQKQIFEQQYQSDFSQMKTNFDLRTLEFERSETLMKETLSYYSSLIKAMFKTHYETFIQTKNIRYLFNDFYHTPAHPDALRMFITYYEAQMAALQEENLEQYDYMSTTLLMHFKEYINQLISDKKSLWYQDLATEKLLSLQGNAIKLTRLNEDINTYQVSLKRLNTSSSEFKALEKTYQKALKEKKSLEIYTEKIENQYKRKTINYDLSIEKVSKKHHRYLHKLSELFNAHKASIITFYQHQQAVVLTLKKSLYMSDSVLDTSIRQSERLEKSYVQRLVFHQQSMFETLTLHYELLLSLIHDEKSLKIQANEQDIKALKAKRDVYISQHEAILNNERRQYRKQIVHERNILELHLKQRQSEDTLELNTLSKTIATQEQQLQNYKQRKNDSLSYHDINTESLRTQLKKSFEKSIQDKESDFKTSMSQLKLHAESTQLNFSNNIASTEQNIESRLVKYRLFVSKKREYIHQKEHTNRQDLVKFDQLLKQKRLQSKRKTKRLLSAIQKEKRRFTVMKQHSERRLIKSYHRRHQDMQKLVTRSHKFKMRFLKFT